MNLFKKLSERRRHWRTKSDRDASVGSGGTVTRGRMVDVSANGALIEITAELAVNHAVELNIADVGNVKGRIARTAKNQVGIEFADTLDEKQMKRALNDLADAFD